MATIKSYTDIEQSKKLAEILPLESADCYWDYDEIQKFHRISWFEDGYNKESQLRLNENNVCAWSLTALLSVLPSIIKRKGKIMFLTLEKAGAYNLYYKSQDRLDELWETKEEPIDACAEMIELLYEQKLL